MITNTSGYGKSKMADGGVKIQFQADTRMEVKTVAPWEAAGSSKENKNVIGLKVTWDVLCSSIGSPYKTCESWIRFGHGIDKVQEILMIAIDQEKVYNYLGEHPEFYALLELKVKEMLY
jgi:hypothetical protein